MRVAFVILSFAGLAILLGSCDPHSGGPPSGAPDFSAADVPLLPVEPGDSWIYEVRLRIPAGVTSAGAAAVDTQFRRVRIYLGKKAAARGLPVTDCFEVSVPGSPRELEFVEIHPDRILIHGSWILRPESSTPLWLGRPEPFMIAGMRPGDTLPDFVSKDGGITRHTRIIAREEVTVPCGVFRCIRLLTTGNDGELEFRRRFWFAPGKGIIREEISRYRRERLIFHESRILAEFISAG